MIPSHIQELYGLATKIIDGHDVYADIRYGMYGLTQAGKLAHEQLGHFLASHGYSPCPISPRLWTDHNSDLMFNLACC